MTVVGITGSREGCNPRQLANLRERLTLTFRADWPDSPRLHHGDCVGVDEQAHNIALELEFFIECHPPIENRFRAYTTGWDVLHREQDYRVRNQAIVDACDILLAVPDRAESLAGRSGTWMTVRMARVQHKPIIIIKGDRW